MPIISHFYGILIYIFKETDGKHHVPHFHAKYAEYKGAYNFEGDLIEGTLPKKQNRLIQAWCSLHEEELNAAWIAWNESGEVIKIDGLR